ncbi:MAG: exported protein of unknown function [Candidatus Saccharibacteria bacterium]|nr:exported protein of unknown function [Candidatus Saccharibacteria bacterium]
MNPQVFPQGSGKHVNKTIIIVVLAVVLAGFVGLAIWALVNYNEQKTNVQGKVDDAVAIAKKTQADNDEVKFAARDKEPNREFVGPDDYGALSFNYPKTWSVYINKDANTSGGTYEAYLNPVSVPAVSTTQQYALRVTIEQQDYNTVITSYNTLVKTGALHSSAVVAANGADGTRLDGNFTKDIRGAAVIFKIRDKTVTLRTDANTFLPDFNALIATIKFNQ